MARPAVASRSATEKTFSWNENPAARLAQFGEQGFHFGARMLVALLCRFRNALPEHPPGILGSRFPSQHLRVHQIRGNIVWITLVERAKVRVRGGRVAGIGAIDGQSV